MGFNDSIADTSQPIKKKTKEKELRISSTGSRITIHTDNRTYHIVVQARKQGPNPTIVLFIATIPKPSSQTLSPIYN